jgi:hypothetical protein
MERGTLRRWFFECFFPGIGRVPVRRADGADGRCFPGSKEGCSKVRAKESSLEEMKKKPGNVQMSAPFLNHFSLPFLVRVNSFVRSFCFI